MIWVNYTRLNGVLPEPVINSFLHQLPPPKASAIARLSDSKQATASVLGLVLLGQGAKQLGVVDFNYDQLIFSPAQKPTCSLGIEFTITHSANIVACAVNLASPLGIDTETRAIHNAQILQHVFSDSEQALIQSDNQHYLDLWVKKEAVAKATGHGLPAMKTIVLDEERAHYNKQLWYLHRLRLDANEVSYLACHQPQPDIQIQKHTFADCIAYCTDGQCGKQAYG